MTPKAFDAACRSLPAVEVVVQWGARDVYKVGGRIFALRDPETPGFSVKVSDIAYEALTASGEARPAPYLARAKWVQFDDLKRLEAGEVAGFIRSAHALVAARLTRKTRAELGLA